MFIDILMHYGNAIVYRVFGHLFYICLMSNFSSIYIRTIETSAMSLLQQLITVVEMFSRNLEKFIVIQESFRVSFS